MPFGRKGTLVKRKGHRKRGRKNDVAIPQEPVPDSSDDYFITCFSSDLCMGMDVDLFPSSLGNESNNDNLRADEYYVILDKPYQFNEHDDLDEFASSKKARVFSELKEQTKRIESRKLTCYKGSNFVRFVSLYDEDTVKVKLVVTVSKDFLVSIQVHKKKLPTSHEIWTYIPRQCYSVSALQKIIDVVGSFSICPGNPDPDLQELIPDVVFIDSKDLPKRQGYRDNYTGKSTILSISCQLLIKSSRCRCNCCQVYRGSLRVLHSRKRKIDIVDTPPNDLLHSRISNKKLTDDQKNQKLKQFKEYTQGLEREITTLKEILKGKSVVRKTANVLFCRKMKTKLRYIQLLLIYRY